MALFKFVDAIMNDRPIDVYGQGRMERDFTYIDDLVGSITDLIAQPPNQERRAPAGIADSLSREGPFRVVNIGGGKPVGLIPFIETIEQAVGKPSKRNMLPMQQGDVPRTYASPDLLVSLTGQCPRTPVEVGVKRFVEWYASFYKTPQ